MALSGIFLSTYVNTVSFRGPLRRGARGRRHDRIRPEPSGGETRARVGVRAFCSCCCVWQDPTIPVGRDSDSTAVKRGRVGECNALVSGRTGRILKNPFSKGSKKTGLLEVPTWPDDATDPGVFDAVLVEVEVVELVPLLLARVVEVRSRANARPQHGAAGAESAAHQERRLSPPVKKFKT